MVCRNGSGIAHAHTTHTHTHTCARTCRHIYRHTHERQWSSTKMVDSGLTILWCVCVSPTLRWSQTRAQIRSKFQSQRKRRNATWITPFQTIRRLRSKRKPLVEIPAVERRIGLLSWPDCLPACLRGEGGGGRGVVVRFCSVADVENES